MALFVFFQRLRLAADGAQAIGHVRQGRWLLGIDRQRLLDQPDALRNVARLQRQGAKRGQQWRSIRVGLEQLQISVPSLVQSALLMQADGGIEVTGLKELVQCFHFLFVETVTISALR